MKRPRPGTLVRVWMNAERVEDAVVLPPRHKVAVGNPRLVEVKLSDGSYHCLGMWRLEKVYQGEGPHTGIFVKGVM
jgi:hypothetical protein